MILWSFTVTGAGFKELVPLGLHGKVENEATLGTCQTADFLIQQTELLT